jgi:hypothetical protein
MSLTNRNPLGFQGAVTNSGNMGNTGQSTWTQGGGQVFSQLSGITAATLIASGGGRLDRIQWLVPMQSGQGVIFYDSAVATSGGPFQTSGHKVLGFLPPTVNPALALASGLASTVAPYPFIDYPGAPFFSGLCAAITPGTVSGTGGFVAQFTLAGLTSGGGNIGYPNQI